MGKLFPAARDKLSHFLLLLLHPRQICNDFCTRTRASARHKAFNTWTILRLRDSFVPRRCASAFSRLHLLGPFIVHLSKLYRDTRNAQSSMHMDGKKCAPVSLRSSGHGIPTLHRDHFLAKEPGQLPYAASGNTTCPA
jgi:hypothetical protein